MICYSVPGDLCTGEVNGMGCVFTGIGQGARLTARRVVVLVVASLVSKSTSAIYKFILERNELVDENAVPYSSP